MNVQTAVSPKIIPQEKIIKINSREIWKSMQPFHEKFEKYKIYEKITNSEN